MQKLATFGCSLTAGAGLSNPLLTGWAGIVARKINLKLKNCGYSGASNKFIWHTMVNSNLQDVDTAVFLWTYHTRKCFFKHNDYHKRITDNDKQYKTYLKNFYFDYDSIIESFTYINYCSMHLDNLGIKNFHFTIDNELIQNVPLWNNTKLNFVSFDKDLPKALDKMHPGEEAQKQVANDILRKLK